MSEASLWDRIRDNVGHMGHFTRLEFNPDAGVPDVDYCVKSVEGKIELKYREDQPARDRTPVFKNGGLRDSQIAWIYTRVRHGGRVWILAQVYRTLYLVPGTHARTFNTYSLDALAEAALWLGASPLPSKGWTDLVRVLARPEGLATPDPATSRHPRGAFARVR